MLPFNTFTIHELLGFFVSASLAVTFYLLCIRPDRRLMHFLGANFVACSAGLCVVAFLTDNLVPAGRSSWGWPGGPSATDLAEMTLRIQRFAWVFGVLVTVTQLHFALCYCDHRNFLRRHIGLVYLAGILVIPFFWTSWWLPIRPEPAAATSSWAVTIPWMPAPNPVVGVLVAACWCAANVYTLILLRWRRRESHLPRPSKYSAYVMAAFFAQMVFGMADIMLGVADCNGISFTPMGAAVMGILLAVALLQERAESDRLRAQLSREKAVLLESIRQPLLYFNRDLKVQWANTHAVPLAGDSAGVVVGRRAEDVWQAEGDQEIALLRRALETGESNSCEMTVPGGAKWITYNTPVLDDKRTPLGVLVLSADVTQIRWAEEVLRNFSAQMLATREEERRRLAGELHDAVAQNLAALHMTVTAEIDSPDVEVGPLPLLKCMAVRLKECLLEIRGVCYDLYPPAIEHFGLPSALSRMIEQCRGTGASGNLVCEGDVAALRFSRTIEIALFRVAQEAMGNAISHGKARQVTVRLAYEGGQMRLAVVDDGIGFDPSDVSRYGIGLSTMRERARGIGGRIDVRSRPGETRVEVCVSCRPVERASSGDDGAA